MPLYSSMIYRRLVELLGILMIGDAVMALLRPRRHVSLWDCGPKWAREAAHYFEKNRELTRAVAVAELAAGVCISSLQTDR